MNGYPRIIAYYLPQYHPFPENDEWWGKGFTEWTNVARAQPLYKGHYQPRIPADLGFYDLRLPLVREEQAALAKEAGIYGFCYWHYWFGNGKQLMADVFDDVLTSGKPDFPFCLGWANHSWYAKNWNTKDTGKDRLLIEQRYLGDSDIRMHYEYVLKAFKDKRYIYEDDMPIFTIFRPDDIPDNFIELWNKWAKEDGISKGIYFIANVIPKNRRENNTIDYLEKGFSAVIPMRLYSHLLDSNYSKWKAKIIWHLNNKISEMAFQQRYLYKDVYPFFSNDYTDNLEYIIPTLIPNFDHSPRSRKNGYILHDSTPNLFKQQCLHTLSNIYHKKNKLVWLRSWNEWGEGNYMEPDLKYGKAYIIALHEAIDEIFN